MSYRSLGWVGFADGTQHEYQDIRDGQPYEKFNQWSWSGGEVYVFRFKAYGLPSPIKNISDARPYLDAYVLSMPTGNRNQDIRGITVSPSGSGGQQIVEIVFTDAGGVHANGDRAGETLAKMAAALTLKGIPASLDKGSVREICCPAYARLTNAEAVQRWLSFPILWSFSRFEASGKSILSQGFTKAWTDGKGVWVGTALEPRYEIQYQPTKPIVVPPEPSRGRGETPSGAETPSGFRSEAEEPTNYAPFVVVGLVALAGIGIVMATAPARR